MKLTRFAGIINKPVSSFRRNDEAGDERLVRDGFMSAQAAEQARNAETTIANDVAAARFRAKSAAAEVRAPPAPPPIA